MPGERVWARVWSFRGSFVGTTMNSIGFAFQLHDRGAVHHAIQQGHRQGRVAEVVGPGLEVDVGHEGRRALLAAGIDDLVPQAGGLWADAAFNAVEAEFVDLC